MRVNFLQSGWFWPARWRQLGRWPLGPSGKPSSSAHSGSCVLRCCGSVWCWSSHSPSRSRCCKEVCDHADPGNRSKCWVWSPPEETSWRKKNLKNAFQGKITNCKLQKAWTVSLHKLQPYLFRMWPAHGKLSLDPPFLNHCIGVKKKKKNSDHGLPMLRDLGSIHVAAIRLVKLSSSTGKWNTEAGGVNDIYHVYLSH